MNYPKIASHTSVDSFRKHIHQLGLELGCDDTLMTGAASPFMESYTVHGRTVGNRWAVHPMEGWDGTLDGRVTEPMKRRWERFGLSGAKMIWGGEAMAVCPEGRANPNQLILSEKHQHDFAVLRDVLVQAHQKKYGRADDLYIGFQLTHSGRFCRPNDHHRWESRIAFRHPLLDTRFKIEGDHQILSDDELFRLIEDYVRAAKVARKAGADFVDIKHCHGYLLHEFLGAHTRSGLFGGSFENRTRLLREIVKGIRAEVPGLEIGVRLSAFDMLPFKPDPETSKPGKPGVGIPDENDCHLPYHYAFGVDPNHPLQYDLTETRLFLKLCVDLGIQLVNLSAGSPYYNPHIQRPALYPPSDGYQPPEDPLVGVARQIQVVQTLKKDFPQLILVGSGYSYLQEFLPYVGQFLLRTRKVDVVGMGRAVLSYPTMLADAVNHGQLEKRWICRTFSDCTTAPRNGLRSGCYPLDEFYKKFEDAPKLKEIKRM